MENKKICFFLTDMTKKGGIERVTSILLNELLQKEINIDIISQFKSYERCSFNLKDLNRLKYISTIPFKEKPGSIARLKKHLFNLKKIKFFFLNNEYDNIISQSFPNTFLLYLAGVDLKKIIAVEHVHYGYYKNPLIKYLRKRVYKKVRKLVVLTEKDMKNFREIGVEAQIIENPVEFSKDNRVSKLNSKKIISVGRLVEQKGYDLLIEASKKIFQKYPDWILEIYGEGPLENELKDKIDKVNLKKNIYLKGTTSNIEEEYIKSSIYVMSSRYEGFPMVLIEASSKGLPCISFDCPNGPSDIIKHNISGFLVEKENIDELSNKVMRLIEEEELRKKMGAAAIKEIKKYNKKDIIDKWEKLL